MSGPPERRRWRRRIGPRRGWRPDRPPSVVAGREPARPLQVPTTRCRCPDGQSAVEGLVAHRAERSQWSRRILSADEIRPVTPRSGGVTRPACQARKAPAGVAQLVAQAICNRQVVGSSPTTGSIREHRPANSPCDAALEHEVRRAGAPDLADAAAGDPVRRSSAMADSPATGTRSTSSTSTGSSSAADVARVLVRLDRLVTAVCRTHDDVWRLRLPAPGRALQLLADLVGDGKTTIGTTMHRTGTPHSTKFKREREVVRQHVGRARAEEHEVEGEHRRSRARCAAAGHAVDRADGARRRPR